MWKETNYQIKSWPGIEFQSFSTPHKNQVITNALNSCVVLKMIENLYHQVVTLFDYSFLYTLLQLYLHNLLDENRWWCFPSYFWMRIDDDVFSPILFGRLSRPCSILTGYNTALHTFIVPFSRWARDRRTTRSFPNYARWTR